MILKDSGAAPGMYRLVVLQMADVVCSNGLHLLVQFGGCDLWPSHRCLLLGIIELVKVVAGFCVLYFKESPEER